MPPPLPPTTLPAKRAALMNIREYTSEYGVLDCIDDLSGKLLDQRPTDVCEFAACAMIDKLAEAGNLDALMHVHRRATAAAKGLMGGKQLSSLQELSAATAEAETAQPRARFSAGTGPTGPSVTAPPDSGAMRPSKKKVAHEEPRRQSDPSKKRVGFGEPAPDRRRNDSVKSTGSNTEDPFMSPAAEMLQTPERLSPHRKASPTHTANSHDSMDAKPIDMDEEKRVNCMAANEFFCVFPRESLPALTKLSTAFVSKRGSRIYCRGDIRNTFILITDGLVRLTEQLSTGFYDLGTFTKGHCLGESAIFSQERRRHQTEALAVNDVTYLTFEIDNLMECCERAGLTGRLMEAAAIVMKNRMRAKTHKETGIRVEKDCLGSVNIPNSAYYGIMTKRACDVFNASGITLSHFPNLIKAMCLVKKASCMANHELGLLDDAKTAAIMQACDEVIEGNMHDEFCVDMLQGGAGVSTMACANEVLANRATELLGGVKGDYRIHPNEHVNMSQSDDAYQTVIRLSIMLSAPAMFKEMRKATQALYKKAFEFRDVVKMGRTMLQDAVPVKMGNEFLAYAKQLDSDLENIKRLSTNLNECLLGGTVLGTGLGSVRGFATTALRHLNDVIPSELKFFTPPDLMKSITDMNCIVSFSSGLRRIAVRISKICNDLRLMASGPRCGLKEINLPEMQPGSSIMPGKVNPVIPEAMNMVSYTVIGNDVTVALAAEGGQLNSCIFDTVTVYSVLENLHVLTQGFNTLTKRCLKGITANKERCKEMVDNSVSKGVCLVSVIGYDASCEVADEALERGCRLEDVLLDKKIISKDHMDELFSAERMSQCIGNNEIEMAEDLEKSSTFRNRMRSSINDARAGGDGAEIEAFLEFKQKYGDHLKEDEMMKAECLLVNEIWSALNAVDEETATTRQEDVLPILEMMDRIDLDAGEYLYKAGDERKYTFLVKKGVIKLQKHSRDGTGQTCISCLSDGQSLGETGLIGCSSLSRHDLSAAAEINTVAYRIDLDLLRPFLAEPENDELWTRLMRNVNAVLYEKMKARCSRDKMKSTLCRIDHDLLGDREVPVNVYWGVQTLRAMENFDITGITVQDFPHLVKAFAYVKKACAIANRDLGLLTEKQSSAIIRACDEIVQGKLADQFPTDMIQGGAGTSTNMNANEVIANRANEILGDQKGTYKYVHPNDHVNKSQSTNDSYPTSLRLSIVLSAGKLIDSMTLVANALRQKGVEFDKVLKMGRTQLQDAVPMTLGQEFFSLSRGIEEDVTMLRTARTDMQMTNLGGTAIGTGICADRDFPRIATRRLSEVTGIPFHLPKDMIHASSDTSGMLTFMHTLKRIALRMSKLCNDLRFLSSGPRAGIGEIQLPCVQPNTSLIPGKSDPDIPEMVTMVAYRVAGSDMVCGLASHGAQLQLNVMEPVMIFRILSCIDMLSNAFSSLTTNCISGIVCNERNCKNLVHNSIGIVTALLPTVGYKNCSRAANIAQKENKPLVEVLLQEKIMTQEEIDRELVPERMVTAAKLAKRRPGETQVRT